MLLPQLIVDESGQEGTELHDAVRGVQVFVLPVHELLFRDQEPLLQV